MRKLGHAPQHCSRHAEGATRSDTPTRHILDMMIESHRFILCLFGRTRTLFELNDNISRTTCLFVYQQVHQHCIVLHATEIFRVYSASALPTFLAVSHRRISPMTATPTTVTEQASPSYHDDDFSVADDEHDLSKGRYVASIVFCRMSFLRSLFFVLEMRSRELRTLSFSHEKSGRSRDPFGVQLRYLQAAPTSRTS